MQDNIITIDGKRGCGMTLIATATAVDGYFKKTIHMAKMMNDKGEVSALCFKNPHAIDLKKETWTNRKEAVTCSKCLKVLEQKQ